MIFSFVIPELLLAVALFLLVTQALTFIGLGTEAEVAGLVVWNISWPAIIVRARLVSIGRSYEEAAADLGASRLGAIRRVLIPMLLPAIFASAVLVFASTVDDFVIVEQLSSTAATQPMSVLIYANVHGGLSGPALNALGHDHAVLLARRRADRLLRVPVDDPGRTHEGQRRGADQHRRHLRGLKMSGGHVELESLTKRFDDVTAVDDISVEIQAGEFFSLLGPSGCGKTSTLRMIAGFEPPTSGKILLDGVDVGTWAPNRRNVNTVFQNYALFPFLTVAENVAFGMRYKSVPKSERNDRVAEALELVQLSGYEKRRPNQLSGGQQQRVALARALVLRPAVLLLDEPLGALDAKIRKQLRLELKALQEEVGITFVFVTHDQEEALSMSDRVAVMNAGRIEQIGTPEASTRARRPCSSPTSWASRT